jgi:uncharacterized protein
MREFGGGLLFSASDLMRFMGCRHATTLDLAYMNKTGPKPREDSEDAALLQKQGDAHERRHLEKLRAEVRSVVEIPRDNLVADVSATCEALTSGPDIVYQGAFRSGKWGGWSDFLERVDTPSALGPFSYEVTDTKLKRRPTPKHVLQLVVYSDLLAEIQKVEPRFAHVELGNGERESLRLSDFSAYVQAARRRLEQFVDKPQATRPVPCSDCDLCRWGDHCTEVWKTEDSLFTVANISKGQVKKLETAGIDTMAKLAVHHVTVRGMAPGTLQRLTTQARLQNARKTGTPAYELRPAQPGKGFSLLPEPQPGDIFYDIEGDPHYDGGLEYLHGVWTFGKFHSFWAHDHQAEAGALSELLEFFRKQIAQYPLARIYHYAPYEVTALRRLTGKYGIGEAFLDRLLRERRFVDLYAVVRGGLICSEENYSIKSLEIFYGITREGEVKTASSSVIAYEKWRETQEQSILDDIEKYNRVDCESTEKLRDWLLTLRPEGPWPQLTEDGAVKEQEDDQEITTLRQELQSAGLSQDRQDMLFNLALFHRREAKPAWWAIFDSLVKDEVELLDDMDALGGLVAKGPGEPIKQSIRRTYEFPVQETKLRSGKSPTIHAPDGFTAATIESFDLRNREVTLKLGKARAELLRDEMTLHPEKPINTAVIADALRDVVADQCGARKYRAVDDLLSRSPPRLAGGGSILATDELVAGTQDAVRRMDETVLPVQGPPGTGKTYVTARAILALVCEGHRVGVASNSHEAIRNVLMGCVDACNGTSSPVPDIIHKISGEDDGYPASCPVRRTDDNADAAANGEIVGGTAFFFARPENVQAFDWLFVDEAGQVGLANMTAMGRAARNIVLVGDPRQLPQVIQGAHPEPANLSCLEWMLGEHATIPPDRGIFLGVTRRMHPAVNTFISDRVYEGRLVSHPECARQAVRGTRFPEAGAFWVPVAHEGNAQVAEEEVTAIRAACEELMKGLWTGKAGEPRGIRAADMIVVAPYNAQVNALRDALPSAIRVGTVDKFQGQEAPICIVSMTASSAEETSRGMEFLFSLNRINVAVSRAMGLALVFGSSRLLETKCETLEQMRLVNTLCCLPAMSG